jgi:hypothetical protein
MAQLIVIIIALFLIYYLILFVIQIVGSILFYIGATPILFLDYITRPITWFNLSSPDIAWGVFGALIGLCVGLLYCSKKLVLLALIPRIKLFVFVFSAIFIALILYAFSLSGSLDIKGSWNGNLQAGSTSFPVQLEVVKDNVSVANICSNAEFNHSNCNEPIKGFVGFFKVKSIEKSHIFDMQGFVMPGSNQIRLSLNTQRDSKFFARVRGFDAKILLGLNDIVASGDIEISGRSQPFDLSLQRHVKK